MTPTLLSRTFVLTLEDKMKITNNYYKDGMTVLTVELDATQVSGWISRLGTMYSALQDMGHHELAMQANRVRREIWEETKGTAETDTG